MKAVIPADGFGMRISEEIHLKPGSETGGKARLLWSLRISSREGIIEMLQRTERL